jgi:hypothetical protein
MPEKEYPFFKMPYGLKIQFDGSKRTKEEAKLYYDVFMGLWPMRILYLLSWHDEMITDDPVADLLRIGEKVAKYVSRPEFHYIEKVEMQISEKHVHREDALQIYDNPSCMGIDMGLLLALFLLQLNSPEIKWHMRMRGKSFLEYHQMFVMGPGVTTYDPIYQARGWCQSIAKGKRSHRIWSEYYLMWVDMLEGREPRSLRDV